MPIRTETFRRESANGLDTIIVMASIDDIGDDVGAEIRVIHERDGKVVTDTIPHWGDDPAAGHRWVEQHRDSCISQGYRVVDECDEPEN
ncbi:hypothetical protein [Actinoplanes sp. NPDC026623]|uniref:hypothetical protein n=1 Tax=Actinoplanes sp. NPDC026623 TaxID=3155610 RepID=UPI003402223C